MNEDYMLKSYGLKLRNILLHPKKSREVLKK